MISSSSCSSKGLGQRSRATYSLRCSIPSQIGSSTGGVSCERSRAPSTTNGNGAGGRSKIRTDSFRLDEACPFDSNTGVPFWQSAALHIRTPGRSGDFACAYGLLWRPGLKGRSDPVCRDAYPRLNDEGPSRRLNMVTVWMFKGAGVSRLRSVGFAHLAHPQRRCVRGNVAMVTALIILYRVLGEQQRRTSRSGCQARIP